MPNIKDQISGIAEGIGMADPVMQISKGISDVGEKAQPYINKAKGLVQQGVDYVGKKLAPTPPPITTDIELPKEAKKKVARPVTRSMSRK